MVVLRVVNRRRNLRARRHASDLQSERHLRGDTCRGGLIALLRLSGMGCMVGSETEVEATRRVTRFVVRDSGGRNAQLINPEAELGTVML